MKPILEIQNISKKFNINANQQPYLSLRDSVSSLFNPKSKTEVFWALQDVSFNVEAGDTIGIIGKNGAGKSTLLKILSKITPPTSGKIICRGRIASLLEVGTGFHPELSGRENIYMNGSILGMRKVEIQKNFDAIVDFAGVEKFIDTPLKHYSSGMQLRLAFAVAAFLENEILIIDEVLAVGDAEFQKKCMGKMGDISQSGRTILFVSHNISSVEILCKKSILMVSGKLINFNTTETVLKNYFPSNHLTDGVVDLKLNSDVIIKEFKIFNKEIFFNGNVNYSLQIESHKKNIISDLAILFYNNKQERVSIIDFREANISEYSTKNNLIKIEGVLNNIPFIDGEYNIGLYINSNLVVGDFLDIIVFKVLQGITKIIPYPKQYRGYVNIINKSHYI